MSRGRARRITTTPADAVAWAGSSRCAEHAGRSQVGLAGVWASTLASASLMVTSLARGEILSMPVFIAWGDNYYGQTDVPADLHDIIQVAAGTAHTVILKGDGTVVSWGWNDFGQTDVPADLHSVSQVAAGNAHTVALKNDGTVVMWGDDSYGQTDAPSDLSGVTQVAAGTGHNLALRNDGTVVAWGWNDFGQTEVPVDLHDVKQIAAGAAHNVVVKNNGTVVAWGWNSFGQTQVPPNLHGVMQVTAGAGHTIALRNDGTLVAWGWNDFGQTNLPSDLRGVTRIAAGFLHTVALKDDGTIVAWGDDYYGQTEVPAHLNGVTQVAAGTAHTIALLEGDCNGDGLLDSSQITNDPLLDLNGNKYLDTCDLARGFEEDCNNNGIIDSFEQNLSQIASADSGTLARIGIGHPQQWVYAMPSLSLDDPTLTIAAYGDFSAPGETLSVSLNGRFVATLYATGSDKNDCRTSMWRTITLPREFYNQCVAAPGGATDAVFDFTTSVAVNADQCPQGSWVRAQIRYTAAVAGDCNANSLLDVCEIALDPTIDSNTDGVIDVCQGMGVVFRCPGDLDGNGGVDTGDVSLLLLNFGYAMPGDPNDLDGSGQVNTADIGLLLLNFGPCI